MSCKESSPDKEGISREWIIRNDKGQELKEMTKEEKAEKGKVNEWLTQVNAKLTKEIEGNDKTPIPLYLQNKAKVALYRSFRIMNTGNQTNAFTINKVNPDDA